MSIYCYKINLHNMEEVTFWWIILMMPVRIKKEITRNNIIHTKAILLRVIFYIFIFFIVSIKDSLYCSNCFFLWALAGDG